jgi:hypothetical protein
LTRRLPPAIAIAAALLLVAACGGNGDSDEPSPTPTAPPADGTPAAGGDGPALTPSEGETILTGAALTEDDLPAGWEFRDELDLVPTPFGFQPEILSLTRGLAFDSAYFSEFTPPLGMPGTQLIEQSLFLYGDEAAAGEAYDTATAETALPAFFGGWPRAYRDVDPSEVEAVASDVGIGQRSASFTSTCPTPGRPQEPQDCAGLFVQSGRLLIVFVASDPLPLAPLDLVRLIDSRATEQLARAATAEYEPFLRCADMTLQSEDVVRWEFSNGVRTHAAGQAYEDAGEDAAAQSMGVLGGCSTLYSDAHTQSQIASGVTIYNSAEAASEGFAFEAAQLAPEGVEGEAADAGDESLAFYGAVIPQQGTTLTVIEDTVVVRIGDVVATIQVGTPEGATAPLTTAEIVDLMAGRVDAERGG